jgi:hypothetical protein
MNSKQLSGRLLCVQEHSGFKKCNLESFLVKNQEKMLLIYIEPMLFYVCGNIFWPFYMLLAYILLVNLCKKKAIDSTRGMLYEGT